MDTGVLLLFLRPRNSRKRGWKVQAATASTWMVAGAAPGRECVRILTRLFPVTMPFPLPVRLPPIPASLPPPPPLPSPLPPPPYQARARRIKRRSHVGEGWIRVGPALGHGAARGNGRIAILSPWPTPPRLPRTLPAWRPQERRPPQPRNPHPRPLPRRPQRRRQRRSVRKCCSMWSRTSRVSSLSSWWVSLPRRPRSNHDADGLVEGG